MNFNDEAKKSAANLLYNTYSPNKSFAFMTSCLIGSQLGYRLIKNINIYLENNPYNEITIYNMQKEPQMIVPRFAIYPALDINKYHGTVISTDIPSWQAAQNCMSHNKYFYVYDILMFNFAAKELVDKINNSHVKIFTRSKAHADYLQKIGLNCLEKFIEEPKIDQIMSLIEENHG